MGVSIKDINLPCKAEDLSWIASRTYLQPYPELP